MHNMSARVEALVSQIKLCDAGGSLSFVTFYFTRCIQLVNTIWVFFFIDKNSKFIVTTILISFAQIVFVSSQGGWNVIPTVQTADARQCFYLFLFEKNLNILNILVMYKIATVLWHKWSICCKFYWFCFKY